MPRIGILGSAIATLVCYVMAALALAWAGRQLLPVALPWGTVLTAGVASVAMYFALIHVAPGRRLVAVAVRVLIGAPIYGGIMVLISPDARDLLRGLTNAFAAGASRERASASERERPARRASGSTVVLMVHL